jgi:hypothetical protein
MLHTAGEINMKHITEQIFVSYEGKSSIEVPYNWFGILFVFATTKYGTKLGITV